MENKTIKGFGAGIFALALAAMCMACAQAAAPTTPAAPSQALPRLDAPVTATNSVLFDFGYGAVLRVPKILFPESAIPKDPKQPIKAQRLSMAFQFPDMVQTSYPSGMESIFEKNAGRYVPQADRFPVSIVWLFYSPGELGNISWEDRGKREVPDFRPPSILRNQEQGIVDYAQYSKHITPAKPTIVDSKYEGLSEVHFPIYDRVGYERSVKIWKENGWDGTEGTQYVERTGSPYELFMRCDSPSSIKCEANIYSKSSRFQYRMIFPPEAVAHADQLIRTIDKMIDGWVRK